ncbi:HmuY family protein [Pendulispora rubella]|uniref:HmuY family protein n=1 Tax=Pendulispora rubella TaxID=2741070 RepID=A0ABZ2KWI9_9BACT
MKHSLFAGILLSSMALTLAAGAVGCSDDESTAVNPGGDAAKDTAPSSDVRGDQSADTGTTDTGTIDTGTDAAPVERCTAAKEQLLKPIDSVSTGDVTVYATSGSTQSIYVNASAGGLPSQDQNPRIYIKLPSSKAAVTDKSAWSSTGWDLALKREVIFTNSGDSGQGQGSAVFLAGKAYEEVTQADAQGKTFASENFFNDDCTPKLDANSKVRTTFSDWYDYNPATHTLAPKAGTWLVKSAAGTLFKLQILSYYSSPDGGVGSAGGHFTLKVEAL